LVETTDGRNHTGLLAEKTDKEIVLKMASDKEVRIPAKEIEHMAPQKNSLMPELLLRDLTAAQAADFMALLTTQTLRTHTALLLPTVRHLHHDGGRIIGTFDKFNFLDLVRALRLHCEVADLLAAQCEREFGTGNIHAADVIGEVFAVFQLLVFDLVIGVMEP